MFTGCDDDKAQFERFQKLARELECDDDEERFNANLKKIAKADLKKDKAEKPKG